MRIIEVNIDGEKFKLAPMKTGAAKEFVRESRDIVKRYNSDTKPTEEEFDKRRAKVVCDSLNRVLEKSGEKAPRWTPERIDDDENMDMHILNTLYNRVLEISGLVPAGDAAPGGEKALKTPSSASTGALLQ